MRRDAGLCVPSDGVEVLRRAAESKKLAWTDADYQQIEELAAIGCTIDEICAVMGMTKQAFLVRRRKEIAAHGKGNSRLVVAMKDGENRMKASIRRRLYDQALQGKLAVLLFLAKEILGQGKQTANKPKDLGRLSDNELAAELAKTGVAGGVVNLPQSGDGLGVEAESILSSLDPVDSIEDLD